MNLANPSAGYDAVPTTPVRLSHDPPRPKLLYGRPFRNQDGWLYGTVKPVGTVPGINYMLESSTDLKAWESHYDNTAGGPGMSLEYGIDPNRPDRDLPRFFRVKALSEAPTPAISEP